ncbi:MAG: hypothetical protein EBZ61_10315 [Micrococcales bacterium]|nr:hypothetical protein [Micrococcales bacterium]
MAETQQPMSSNDVGSVTGSSSKARRARGVSDAQDVSPKINQDNFFKDLDSLVGIGREQGGCSVGILVSKLDEPIRSKLIQIMKNEKVNSARLAEVMLAYGLQVSSGKDGCKCPRES